MNTTSLSRSAALFRAVLLCGTLGACGGGGSDAPGLVDQPAPPAVSPPAPAPVSFAYLVQSDKVEVCQIDSGNMLVDCMDAGVSGFQKMRAMAIAGSNAYLADAFFTPSEIVHCRIEPTGALSGCATSGVTGLLAEPNGLAARGSTLYIGNFVDPIVRKCEIKTDGSLDACVDAEFLDNVAIAAEDLQIVGTTAYILHYNENLVSKCAILDDGTLSGCADAGASGLDNPRGFAISGSYLYVANEGPGAGAAGNVTRCLLDTSGLISDCMDAGANVSSPNHIAVRGSSVYITNSSTADSLTHCTAGSNGLLTGCTSIPGNALYSIAIRQ